MKTPSVKTVVVNAAVTFIQAAVAFLAVNGWNFQDKTVVAGAVGAGISVVWNTVIKPFLKEKGWL